MPYIKDEDKARAQNEPVTAGELNYAITRLLTGYLMRRGMRYQFINDCVGAAYGAVAELQRRVVGPYENTKIEENGDVYPLFLLSGD